MKIKAIRVGGSLYIQCFEKKIEVLYKHKHTRKQNYLNFYNSIL